MRVRGSGAVLPVTVCVPDVTGGGRIWLTDRGRIDSDALADLIVDDIGPPTGELPGGLVTGAMTGGTVTGGTVTGGVTGCGEARNAGTVLLPSTPPAAAAVLGCRPRTEPNRADMPATAKADRNRIVDDRPWATTSEGGTKPT